MSKCTFIIFILISFFFTGYEFGVPVVYAVDNDSDSVNSSQNEPELSYELDNSDIEKLNRNFIEIEYALKDKDYEKAIRLLKESEMIDPLNENITRTLSVTLANYSVYLSSINDFKTALKNIEEAYVVAPSAEIEKIYKNILNNYIVNLIENRDWEPALENLHYLYTLDRSNKDLINKIAQIYTRWGLELVSKNENDKAEDKFVTSLRYDRFHKDALFYLGYLLYNVQDLRGAKYYWTTLAENDSGYMNVSQFLKKLERELDVEENFQYKDDDRFQLHYAENLNKNVIDDINSILNEAYSKIGAQLSCYPDRKITVLLMDRKDFFLNTNLPHWIGGVYDGKIRLPVPEDKKNSVITEEFRQIIFHEYTHVIIHDLAGDRIPLWFNEGLAEYLSGKETDYSLLKDNLLNNAYIEFIKLNPALSDKSNPQRMRLAYESSMSLVDFIISRYGMGKIKKMISFFSEGKTQPEIFKTCFGLNEIEFEQQWKKNIFNNLLSFTERKKVRFLGKKKK